MAAPQRLLDPQVLSRISTIELVARTVVEGFVAGLHRSPYFGFSQEFAEYRPYVPGDDPRFVDWNVFARTERTYLKRYLGETNTQLVLLFDSSASMGYRSSGVSKIEFARYLAASLAYLALHQHDAVGNDIILVHVLDPAELVPQLSDAALLEDMETGERMEVAPEYARQEYRRLIQSHIQKLQAEARGAGADYLLLDTSRPLDTALKEYLLFRQKRM
ncbi:MAG: DUF58 domain-containing protein [Acidobacteria bacterium]|nr:DUF58 domain-containing protein [Acidobacteriota bacterium]